MAISPFDLIKSGITGLINEGKSYFTKPTSQGAGTIPDVPSVPGSDFKFGNANSTSALPNKNTPTVYSTFLKPKPYDFKPIGFSENESKLLPKINLPPIIGTPAKTAYDLTKWSAEAIPKIGLETVDVIKKARNPADTSVPFGIDPSRYGAFNPTDANNINSLWQRTLDKQNQLDKESPATPIWNTFRSFMEGPGDVVFSAFEAGSLTKGVTKNVLNKIPTTPAEQSIAWASLGRPKNLDEAEATFRQLAKEYHPDRGGDPALFNKATDAINVLRKQGIPQQDFLAQTFRDVAERLNSKVDFKNPLGTVAPKPGAPFIGTKGFLPGSREVPGQAPAMGLSTRKVENVGYGDDLSEELSQKGLELEFRKETLSNTYFKNIDPKLYTKEGSLTELGDMKNSKMADRMQRNMAEAGISDPTVFAEKLTEYRSRVKQLAIDEKQFKTDVAQYRKGSNKTPIPTSPLKTIASANKIEPANLSTGEARSLEEVASQQQGASSPLPDLNKKETYSKTPTQTYPLEKPTGLFGTLKNDLNPLRAVDEPTKKIFTDWNRDILISKERARSEVSSLKSKIVAEGGSDDIAGIKAYEAGKASSAIKNTFDDFKREAENRGIKEFSYKDNYVPHVYDNPKDINKASIKFLESKGFTHGEAVRYVEDQIKLSKDDAKRLKLSPTFNKERTFSDYATAEQYGLKPKYKTVSELAGYYADQLEKAVAGKKLMETLKAQGKILEVTGHIPKGYVLLNPQFSSKHIFMARPNVAKVVNSLFPDTSVTSFGKKFFATGAKVAQKTQEIVLSAGIPASNFNYFSVGQLLKELTAGNFKAIPAFLRANINYLSLKYFEREAPYIKMMARQGIDLSSRLGQYGKKTYIELVKSKEWVESFGYAFDKAFNEKTFASFMPQLQIGLFKSVYLKALSKGMSKEAAEKFAGDVVKNNFGLFEGGFARSKEVENVLSTLFFAPKFRESIIRVVTNAVKGGWDLVKHPLIFSKNTGRNKTYNKNIALIAGTALTYLAYNLLNKKLNGNYMWDNPDGREISLRIPTGNENGDILYIDILPGTAALPRIMIQGLMATARGDVKTATSKFGAAFSQPIHLGTDIIGNSDHWGNQIYKDTDSGSLKMWKIAKYVGLSVNHPYVKELFNQIEDKKPLYQSVSNAIELPIKFSSVSKERKSLGLPKTRAELADEVEKKRASGEFGSDQVAIEYLDGELAKIKKAEKKIRMEMPDDEYATELDNLVSTGQMEEGDALDETDDYNKYQKEVMIPRGKGIIPTGKGTYSKTTTRFFGDFLKAYFKDPKQALKATFSPEELGDVEGNQVAFKRYFNIQFDKPGGSDEFKKALMAKEGISLDDIEDYKLEHLIPKVVGGDNSPENLYLEDTDTHNSYTKVETALGNAVQTSKITQKEAQALALKFKKDKTMSAEDVIKALK